jgi:flotillin
LAAAGRAEGTRLEGQAQAEVTKARGLADAEIILAKGQAEANAMAVKADAYQEYNQAAVIDKLLTGLPDVVRAMSEPLSKVDKITVVSTGDGNGSGAGMNRVTGDIAQMVAQVPALVEGLTGVDVNQMLQDIPAVRQNGASGSRGGRARADASLPVPSAPTEGQQPKQEQEKDKEIAAPGELIDAN